MAERLEARSYARTNPFKGVNGCAAVVFVLALGVYFNSLRNDFNFDDIAIIKNNSLVQHLSNLPKLFVSNYWANTPYEKGVLLYRPLVMASFALDYAVWGNNPFGFHLTNILINAVNAVLLMVLLKYLFGERVGLVGLGISTLLFAFHPVHTEAINMVVGRTELLAALFGLLTFILCLQGRNTAAALSFFLAMLSKEIAITVPVMLFLHQSLSGRSIDKRRYLMFAGVVVLYPAIRFAVLRGFVSIHQTGILDRQNIFQRALTVVQVLGYYLKLLLAPYPLTPDYSDVALPDSVMTAWVLVPAAAISAMLYSAWRSKKREMIVSFSV